ICIKQTKTLSKKVRKGFVKQLLENYWTQDIVFEKSSFKDFIFKIASIMACIYLSLSITSYDHSTDLLFAFSYRKILMVLPLPSRKGCSIFNSDLKYAKRSAASSNDCHNGSFFICSNNSMA